MRSLFLALTSFAFILVSGGCATSFTGDAHYPGGARACFAKCASEQMQMSGFVFMGEYSSACVCEPRRTGAVAAAGEVVASNSEVGGAGAAGATGAVGVILQARMQQQQQQR